MSSTPGRISDRLQGNLFAERDKKPEAVATTNTVQKLLFQEASRKKREKLSNSGGFRLMRPTSLRASTTFKIRISETVGSADCAYATSCRTVPGLDLLRNWSTNRRASASSGITIRATWSRTASS